MNKKKVITTDIKQTVVKSKRSKNKRMVSHGLAHVYASFNNTIIMVSDLTGNALTIASAGSCGFRGGKKGTAYAAQIATNQAVNQAVNGFGIKKLDIFVRGVGQGRDSALRTLLNKGLQVSTITDKTTIPHGGVRPRKARRV